MTRSNKDQILASPSYDAPTQQVPLAAVTNAVDAPVEQNEAQSEDMQNCYQIGSVHTECVSQPIMSPTSDVQFDSDANFENARGEMLMNDVFDTFLNTSSEPAHSISSGLTSKQISYETCYNDDSGDEYGSICDEDLIAIEASDIYPSSNQVNHQFDRYSNGGSEDIAISSWAQNPNVYPVIDNIETSGLHRINFQQSGETRDNAAQIKDDDGCTSIGEGTNSSDGRLCDAAESSSDLTTILAPVNKSFRSPFVRKAIARPKPPQSIRDRSPINGISASSMLRVCFRIGEAINYGSTALKKEQTTYLELYARVGSSEREINGVKQYFEFWDLFHDKPPYVTGHYDLWKGNELWDYESGQFLEAYGDKKLCRCICRPKMEDNKMILVVLNIWEACWEDVDYVKSVLTS